MPCYFHDYTKKAIQLDRRTVEEGIVHSSGRSDSVDRHENKGVIIQKGYKFDSHLSPLNSVCSIALGYNQCVFCVLFTVRREDVV